MIDTSLFRFKTPVEMRWSDCDMLGHVNNAVYLTYSEQARSAYCANLDWDWEEHGFILAKTEIQFKKPLLYTDKPFIYTRISRLGTKSFDMEAVIFVEKEGKEELVATIHSVLVMWHYKTNHTFPIPQAVKDRIMAYEQHLAENVIVK